MEQLLSLLGITQLSQAEDIVKQIATVSEACRRVAEGDRNTVVLLASQQFYEFCTDIWTCGNFTASSDDVVKALSLDGCDFPQFAPRPVRLVIARTILACFADDPVMQTPEFMWCRIRVAGLYQWLLDESSITLKTELSELISNALTCDRFQQYLKSKEKEAVFMLECHQWYISCLDSKQAKICLDKAVELSGLQVTFSAALGKRTRFQTENVAQLVVQVESRGNSTMENADAVHFIPKNIPLDDDTFLEDIKFESSDIRSAASKLAWIDQAVIVAQCCDYIASLPKEDNLLTEEVAAYIAVLLANPCCWAVQYKSLYLRSIWEQISAKSRQLDRSMRQLEYLSTEGHLQPTGFHGKIEDNNLFSVLPPTPWTTQRKLGEVLYRLGSIRSGIELFERLHSWTEVIAGYQRVGQLSRAETLIRERLQLIESESSPERQHLLIALGDCTGDVSHYEAAWAVSGGRSSKAQRNLGLYAMKQRQWATAIEAFDRSLVINPLQTAVWFAYGCAGLALSKYEVAAKGFHRSVQLEPDNYEAWGNLATAYIKSGQKQRAFCMLQEAIRCQYENWRLWENYLLVAIDCGHFDEAIKSCHRLLDLRKSVAHSGSGDKLTLPVDADIISVLVKAIRDPNLKDGSGKAASSHRHALLELLGRLTAGQASHSGQICSLYAEAILAVDEPSDEDLQRAIAQLQRAIRCYIMSPDIQTDQALLLVAFKDALELCNVLEKYSQRPNATEVESTKSSVKYLFNSLIGREKIARDRCITEAEGSNDLSDLVAQLDKWAHKL